MYSEQPVPTRVALTEDIRRHHEKVRGRRDDFRAGYSVGVRANGVSSTERRRRVERRKWRERGERRECDDHDNDHHENQEDDAPSPQELGGEQSAR